MCIDEREIFIPSHQAKHLNVIYRYHMKLQIPWAGAYSHVSRAISRCKTSDVLKLLQPCFNSALKMFSLLPLMQGPAARCIQSKQMGPVLIQKAARSKTFHTGLGWKGLWFWVSSSLQTLI